MTNNRALERQKREVPHFHHIDRTTQRLCITDRRKALAMSDAYGRIENQGQRKVATPTLATGVGEVLSFWRVGPLQ
jgi:hypothetical protein